MKVRTLAVFAACALIFAAAPAFGQDGDPGAGESAATTPYYIPGMPIPQDGAEAPSSGTTQGSAGGKIGKVTTSERGSLTTHKELDRKAFTPEQLYRGITPGIHDWHRFAARARDAAEKNPRKKNRLTWIGYQPTDRGSRIFLQTIKAATYNVDEGVDKDGNPTVEVTLVGTAVPGSNNKRSLDTSYFPSAVIGARAKRFRRSTVVTIQLQQRVPFSLHQEGEFLFVDFDDAGTIPKADLEAPPSQSKKASK